MAYMGVFLIFCLGGVTLSESATGFMTIGANCVDNSGCTITDASCQNNICDCNPTFVPRSDELGCLPEVTNYQGACEESIQCKIPNIPDERLSCENGRCVCKRPFSFRDGSCLGNARFHSRPVVSIKVYVLDGCCCSGSKKKKPRVTWLGEGCKDDRECSVFTENDIKVVWCFNDFCSCRKGYIQKNNRCVIGGNCENDQDCTGESNSGLNNSFCDKRRTRELWRCACKAGYVSAVNDTECLEEKSKLGDSCEDNPQCSSLLGAAECRNNRCVCRQDAKEHHGKCNGASALASISALLLMLFIPTRFIV